MESAEAVTISEYAEDIKKLTPRTGNIIDDTNAYYGTKNEHWWCFMSQDGIYYLHKYLNRMSIPYDTTTGPLERILRVLGI